SLTLIAFMLPTPFLHPAPDQRPCPHGGLPVLCPPHALPFPCLVLPVPISKPLGKALKSARCITGGVLTTTPGRTTTVATSDAKAPAIHPSPDGGKKAPGGDQNAPGNQKAPGGNQNAGGDQKAPERPECSGRRPKGTWQLE
ncbi:unnamed protein product, partial [Closterium sp. NIES-54]